MTNPRPAGALELLLWELACSSGTAEGDIGCKVPPVGPLSQGSSSLCITTVPGLSLLGFGCLSL